MCVCVLCIYIYNKSSHSRQIGEKSFLLFSPPREINLTHCLVKPWITCGMLRFIKTKSVYYKKSFNNPLFKPIFRQYSNKLTQLLRISKTNYYKNQFEINKNNAKKIWQNINSIIGKTQKTHEFSMNANILNNFFVDIGKFKPNKVDIDHVILTISMCLMLWLNRYF